MGIPCEKGSRFTNTEKISEGAFKGFSRCRDAKTRQIVAILRTEYSGAMVKMLTDLSNHPHVVKFQEVVLIPDNQCYLVFEYIEGTFAEFDGPFSEVERILDQLLSGLAHFHSCGKIPSVLNSSNVLLNNKGMVKIASFEHVKSPSSDQRQGLRPIKGKDACRNLLMEHILKALKSCCFSSTENLENQSPPATVVKIEESCKERLAAILKGVPPYALPLVESLFADPPNHI